MERKIEYYEEENVSLYMEHLENSSMKECVASWREIFCDKIIYPCEIVVYGYAEKNKNDYVPYGKEILNNIYDDMYNNGFIEDYSSEYYDKKLIKIADKLSELVKKNIPPYYEAVKKYTLKVYEDSYEIINVGDYKE